MTTPAIVCVVGGPTMSVKSVKVCFTVGGVKKTVSTWFAPRPLGLNENGDGFGTWENEIVELKNPTDL